MIKAFYSLVFILVLIIANYLNFDSNFSELDFKMSNLVCHRSAGDVTMSLEKTGIYFYSGQLKDFNYKDFYSNMSNQHIINKIFDICLDDENMFRDIYGMQLFYEFKKVNSSLSDEDLFALFERKYNTKNQIIKSTDPAYSVELFDINPVFTYSKFIEGLALVNFVILFIFGLLRALFLYIVTGNFFGKNKSS